MDGVTLFVFSADVRREIVFKKTCTPYICMVYLVRVCLVFSTKGWRICLKHG